MGRFLFVAGGLLWVIIQGSSIHPDPPKKLPPVEHDESVKDFLALFDWYTKL